MVAYTFNPSTERLRQKYFPELKASLVYMMRPTDKNKKKQKPNLKIPDRQTTAAMVIPPRGTQG